MVTRDGHGNIIMWLRVNHQQVPNTDRDWGLTINRFLTHFTNLNTILLLMTINFTIISWPRCLCLRCSWIGCYQPLPTLYLLVTANCSYWIWLGWLLVLIVWKFSRCLPTYHKMKSVVSKFGRFLLEMGWGK